MSLYAHKNDDNSGQPLYITDTETVSFKRGSPFVVDDAAALLHALLDGHHALTEPLLHALGVDGGAPFAHIPARIVVAATPAQYVAVAHISGGRVERIRIRSVVRVQHVRRGPPHRVQIQLVGVEERLVGPETTRRALGEADVLLGQGDVERRSRQLRV